MSASRATATTNINSLEEAASLFEDEIRKRLAKIRDTLIKAGAHHVVDTFDELPAVIEDVNQRLARGPEVAHPNFQLDR